MSAVSWLTFLQRLKYWLDKEHRKKKKGAPFDFTGWEDYVLKVGHCGLKSSNILTRSYVGHATTRERL